MCLELCNMGMLQGHMVHVPDGVEHGHAKSSHSCHGHGMRHIMGMRCQGEEIGKVIGGCACCA
jgi:hypothetical protein